MAATANKVYFDPQNSSASYCHTVDVAVWVNATNFQSGQMTITYDPSCAEVTNWVLTVANFPFGTWNTSVTGAERIGFVGSGMKTGEYQIGTLTIHCINDSEAGCETALQFVPADCILFDDFAVAVEGVLWQDGSFASSVGMCGDVNCDETINVGDVTLLLNHWGSPATYPLCNDWAGDVNCDQSINVGDVTLLLNHWGAPATYPLSCC
jgi:hypothetical protein